MFDAPIDAAVTRIAKRFPPVESRPLTFIHDPSGCCGNEKHDEGESLERKESQPEGGDGR